MRTEIKRDSKGRFIKQVKPENFLQKWKSFLQEEFNSHFGWWGSTVLVGTLLGLLFSVFL